MKTIATVLALLMLAGPAAAQPGGKIGVYSDYLGYSNCNLIDAVYVYNNVYVVHTTVSDASVARFKVVDNWDAYDGAPDYGGNIPVGNVFTGVTVAYGSCKPLPHLIVTLKYVPVAPAPPCTIVQVVPDPGEASGQIVAVDCSDNVLVAAGGFMCVNTFPCCDLNGEPVDCELPVRSEATTWGAIKGLYR